MYLLDTHYVKVLLRYNTLEMNSHQLFVIFLSKDNKIRTCLNIQLRQNILFFLLISHSFLCKFGDSKNKGQDKRLGTPRRHHQKLTFE